jgi:NAD+ synthase (glutamine-hydrolysing)
MYQQGILKVAAATPKIEVGNLALNQASILNMLNSSRASMMVFPELTVTGYSASDLFYQASFLKEALESLKQIIEKTTYQGIYILGMPLDIYGALYNTAVVILGKHILGVVPKYYIPNHHEFYEKRWFHSGVDTKMSSIQLLDQTVPFGALIFHDTKKDIRFGVEVCQDLWATYSPSDDMSLAGVNVMFNLSASSEYVLKPALRRNTVLDHSRKQMGAYIYTSTGIFESTSEVTYSPHQIIGVLGELVCEYQTYDMNEHVLYADIDVTGMNFLRRQDSTYRDTHFKHLNTYQEVLFELEASSEYVFEASLDTSPFIPKRDTNEAIEQAFHLQVLALTKRILSMPSSARNIIIGVSGGLDSTLALMCAHQAMRKLHLDPSHIIAVTMPSEVTTSATKSRAKDIMTYLGCTSLEIPIHDMVKTHLTSIDHQELDVTYENAQARVRTLVLMDLANKYNGFVLGTGDLSEIALGFMTYNGDHMSMYAINSGLPKTWVKLLVSYYAKNIYEDLKDVLNAVIKAPITPELKNNQDSETTIGSYDINDFLIYHHLVMGASKDKMKFLLHHAFQLSHEDQDIYVTRFFKRFYQSQFKRQTLPEGPKILNFSLSPRGEYRLPSDVKVS